MHGITVVRRSARDAAPIAAIAITAFVLSLLWIGGFGSIAAIICAAVSMRNTRTHDQAGRGLAVAALIIGILGLISAVGFLCPHGRQLWTELTTQQVQWLDSATRGRLSVRVIVDLFGSGAALVHVASPARPCWWCRPAWPPRRGSARQTHRTQMRGP